MIIFHSSVNAFVMPHDYPFHTGYQPQNSFVTSLSISKAADQAFAQILNRN
jgi:hypothetical protein